MLTSKTKNTSFIIIVIGSILALFQLIYNRSLWVDEAMLALNIVTKTSYGLLNPLDLNQVAPILFLQLEKIGVVLIPNEIGLRLFPFLGFIISLVLFSKLLQYKISAPQIIIGLSLFAFNPNLIYFATEVKQYIFDVLLITTVYFCLVNPFSNANIKLLLLCIFGCIGIFLSNVSPIVLLTAGLYLIFENKNNYPFILKKLSLLFLSWLLVFAYYYSKFIYKHPSQKGMVEYWESRNAFLPRDFFSYDFVYFIAKKVFALVQLVAPIDHYICYTIIIISMLAGVIQLIQKRKTQLALLIFFPILIHLLLSYLKLYPFESRLILYFTPGLILLTTLGIRFLTEKITYKKAMILSVTVSSLLLINILFKLPLKREEIKENLIVLKKKRTENEGLYIYFGAENAFNFYQAISFYKTNNVIFGNPYRENPDLYLDEIIKIKNGKLWILFSHNYQDEENKIITDIKKHNFKVLDKYISEGSSLYLIE